MENFEELIRKMHTHNSKRVEDKSFIEEIQLKLSLQDQINKSNEINKIFFDKLNQLNCFQCKNGIIKFTNLNNYSEKEIKNIFDTVVELYKYFRNQEKEKFNTHLKLLRKLVKENLVENESEM